jgi:hypothetical protein
MKKVLGIFIVALMCIALGISVFWGRENAISLISGL